MIVSNEHEFIFINVPKVASTSIQFNLSAFCNDPADIVSNMKDMSEDLLEIYKTRQRNFRYKSGKVMNKHESLVNLKKHSLWDRSKDYYKFCFERNPWEKCVSKYLYMKRVNEMPFASMDFDNYLKKCKVLSSYDMYCLDGKIAVDFIGMFESLNESWKHVCKTLDLEFKPLPHEKQNVDKDYGRFFKGREDRINKVAEIYHREIELLRYEYPY